MCDNEKRRRRRTEELKRIVERKREEVRDTFRISVKVNLINFDQLKRSILFENGSASIPTSTYMNEI